MKISIKTGKDGFAEVLCECENWLRDIAIAVAKMAKN